MIRPRSILPPGVGPLVLATVLLLLAATRLDAQGYRSRRYQGFRPSVGYLRLEPLFAGTHEPRLDAHRDFGNREWRFNAGLTAGIYGWQRREDAPMDDWVVDERMLGVDFFTSSRFDTVGGGMGFHSFDFYAGGHAAWTRNPDRYRITDIRLRAGYVSSLHRENFSDSSLGVEHGLLLDAMAGTNTLALGLDWGRHYGLEDEAYPSSTFLLRPYAGTQIFLGSLPVTLRSLIPYAGFDGHWQLWGSWWGDGFTLTLFGGYQARLIGGEGIGIEQRARLGLKTGKWGSIGMRIDAEYNNGDARYAPIPGERRGRLSLGIGLEHLVRHGW